MLLSLRCLDHYRAILLYLNLLQIPRLHTIFTHNQEKQEPLSFFHSSQQTRVTSSPRLLFLLCLPFYEQAILSRQYNLLEFLSFCSFWYQFFLSIPLLRDSSQESSVYFPSFSWKKLRWLLLLGFSVTSKTRKEILSLSVSVIQDAWFFSV